MKKLFLPLLLMTVFISCKIPQVFVGMNEQQFQKEHRIIAQQVELSNYRTVYKEAYTDSSYRFYYFKDGKLYLMDQGYVPFGSKKPLPSR
jgi:hypothetical protein